ncbi:MAG: Uma2 family endonuclease [Verrucomicrobiaceae bacterium]|nr:Uma2 family endonuclease [Verrucomicrobiaceae bacterium]
MSQGDLTMSAAILETLLQAPDLPELIEQARRSLATEQKMREKFYADITPEHKWEFIQGEVIMHSPALNRHLQATKAIFKLMEGFVTTRGLGDVQIEKAMTCFPRNDYEPDIMFFGTAKMQFIFPDTLRFPIPDLIVEVLSPSTEKRDRGVKFEDYALHGVGEYWIVDTEAETIELHRLRGSVYPPAVPQKDGILSSEIIPGFEMPVRAAFDPLVNAEAMKAIWTHP